MRWLGDRVPEKLFEVVVAEKRETFPRSRSKRTGKVDFAKDVPTLPAIAANS